MLKIISSKRYHTSDSTFCKQSNHYGIYTRRFRSDTNHRYTFRLQFSLFHLTDKTLKKRVLLSFKYHSYWYIFDSINYYVQNTLWSGIGRECKNIKINFKSNF